MRSSIYAAGTVNAEAVMIGTTSRDGTIAAYGALPTAQNTSTDPTKREAQYLASLALAFGGAPGVAEAVRNQYPLDHFSSGAGGARYALQKAMIASDGDSQVFCPSLDIGLTLAGRGIAVHHFVFAHYSLTPGCDPNWGYLPVNETVPGWASHGRYD